MDKAIHKWNTTTKPEEACKINMYSRLAALASTLPNDNANDDTNNGSTYEVNNDIDGYILSFFLEYFTGLSASSRSSWKKTQQKKVIEMNVNRVRGWVFVLSPSFLSSSHLFALFALNVLNERMMSEQPFYMHVQVQIHTILWILI